MYVEVKTDLEGFAVLLVDSIHRDETECVETVVGKIPSIYLYVECRKTEIDACAEQ